MEVVISLLSFLIILEIYNVVVLYLRKEKNIMSRVIRTIVLVFSIYVCYRDLNYSNTEYYDVSYFYLSIILIFYILITTIYTVIKEKKYISILSVKKAIDLDINGIMFLNSDGDIILINNTMKKILDYFNIKNNYIDSILKLGFRSDHLIKCLDKVYQLNIVNNIEIVMVDVTDIYKLQEVIEVQNINIDKNNKKILKSLDNLEKIEKTKNLMRLKNEFHDLLGHRLSLFQQYLNNKDLDVDKDDISFMIDNLFLDEDRDLDNNSKLEKLINVYKLFGINIEIKEKLPNDNDVALIFFEIIREAISNAIIHADSKNIKILVKEDLEKIEMTITNDGQPPNKFINEGEGIKGMRRKLNDIGGYLTIDSHDNFVLTVLVQK